MVTIDPQETSDNRLQYQKRLERYYRRLSAEQPDRDLPRFSDTELELFLTELKELSAPTVVRNAGVGKAA